MLARRRIASGVRLSNFVIASTLFALRISSRNLFSSSGVHGGVGVAIISPFAFSPPAPQQHNALSKQLGYRKDRCQPPKARCGFVSFPLRLEPDLDQAADGFGSAGRVVLLGSPLVDRFA